MRQIASAPLLALLLAGSVRGTPPDRWQTEKLAELQVDYRRIDQRHRLESLRREDRVRILEAAVDLEMEDALKWAIGMTRESGDLDLQRSMMQYFERKRSGSHLVIGLFREIAASDSPLRTRARDFLIRWAVKENQQPWLVRLFQTGSMEEKFLAVQAMGLIASGETIGHAWKLLEDRSWTPSTDGVVNAGTLARALQSFEGEDAACFLLLLRRDDRFRPEDVEAIRHATRLWKHADLNRYVSLRALGDPDSVRRATVARFMGRVGFEAARAPLLAMAQRSSERVEVRVAATEALGGMRLARGALARKLRALLADPEAKVCAAAVRALGRLGVKQAAEALVGLLDGPLGEQARAQLAARNGLPAETDWSAWISRATCPLPDGT